MVLTLSALLNTVEKPVTGEMPYVSDSVFPPVGLLFQDVFKTLILTHY